VAHLDPGIITKIDVENDANCLIEIVVPLKCRGRRKRHAIIAMLSQEPLDAPEHAGVVINHKHDFSFRQVRWSCSARALPRTFIRLRHIPSVPPLLR
jgi:hypothetical protein